MLVENKTLPRTWFADQRNRARRNLDKIILIPLFVIPGIVLFCTFVLMPVAQSVRYSLYPRWDGFGAPTLEEGDHYDDNYTKMFEDKRFQTALKNTSLLMLLSLGAQLPIAMILALLVGRGDLPGRAFFRGLLFIPYVFSEVIAAIIWQYVLRVRGEEGSGPANQLLQLFVPGASPIDWLGDKQFVMYAVFAVLTWKYFGFYMILYMAGLQSVSKDLEEAARVDGANWLQVITRITLPLIGNTIRLTVFLSILGSFQQIVIVQVLTRGGNPFNSGHVITTYLYKFGFKSLNMGYGSAVAVVLAAMCLLFSIGYQRIIMGRDYEM
jgi:raffinose/stachyose/melibiose transport system permease protein